MESGVKGYRELAELGRRISFLESKNNISLNERKELAILELARVVEFKDLGRTLIAREG